MPLPDGTMTPEEAAALSQAASAVPTITGDPMVDAELARVAQATGPMAMPPASPVAAPPGIAQLTQGVVPFEPGSVTMPQSAPTDAMIYAPADLRAANGVPAAPAAPAPAATAYPKTDPSVYAAGSRPAPPVGFNLQMPTLPTGGFGGEQAQAGREQEAIKALGATKAAAADTTATAMEGQAASIRTEADHIEKATSEHMNNIDTFMKDAGDQKIDPNRLWKNKGDAGRVSSLIGIVLGGIGSGMSGGPNMALEVINRQIDRDINAQTAEMEQKNNLVRWAFQKTGTMLQAKQLASTYQLAAAKVDVDARAARASGPVQKAEAAALSATIDRALAAKVGDFGRQMGMYRMGLEYQNRMLNGQGGGPQPERVIPGRISIPPPAPGDPKAVQEFIKARNEMGVSGPTAGSVVYVAPGDKAVVSNRISGIQGLENTITRMKGLATSSLVGPGARQAEYERLRGTAAGEWSRVLGGTPGPDAMKEFASMFPSTWEEAYGTNRFSGADHALYAQKTAIYGTYAGVDPSYIPKPAGY